MKVDFLFWVDAVKDERSTRVISFGFCVMAKIF
jgi:hypothetical protein